MEDNKYSILRKLSFWFFFFAFIVFAPIILFYSLGYKFDIKSAKFQRTGAISIKTVPQQVEVYLDNKKISESSPYAIRGLLPKKYTLRLEREGFYPYKIPVEVKSASVSDIDVVLLPKMKNIEEINLDFNVRGFFVVKHLFGRKIIVFTDDGIYLLDEKFTDVQKIAALDLSESVMNTIEGLQEGKNQLIFWNKKNIWKVKLPQGYTEDYGAAGLIYSANESIKDVFAALKDKYLVIHEGQKIIILDITNYSVYFTILRLKSQDAKIFYDSDSETLLVKDREAYSNKFSLFKINLMEYIHEGRAD